MLQIRFAAAVGQGGLERGELRGRSGGSGSRSTGCWWAYGEVVRCCFCVSAAGELEDSGRVLTMERGYPVFDHGCWSQVFSLANNAELCVMLC